MRVAIVGSRDYPDLQQVSNFVGQLARKYPDATVVSGGARGVDSVAECAALANGLRLTSFRPKPSGTKFTVEKIVPGLRGEAIGEYVFDSYGHAAFFRNRLIVKDADYVVAFTTGSKGTANSLKIAEELGITSYVFRPTS